ncbi:glutathione S-transferase family protein [Sphingomonas sp.]|uniref:glutathione S-transferase family protein n=1 Tax=Sphingomonas sp. TaxID=28214 RepID=UPI002869F32B|nr:glutathione S-transferase family protein [Sphingomonas sp.]
MADIIFYTNPMSRGQIVRWMLEEVGQPYDSEIVDYAVMHDAAYHAINPMMKVPAIVHHGRTVTECAGIIAYLADVFPEAGLGPREEEKADYYRWLLFAAGPIEQAVTNKANGFDPSEEKGRMFGYGNYDLAVSTLADHLAGRAFVCGDRFTAADVYVGSQVLWGTQFGTLPSLQPFLDYGERLSVREAYQRGKGIDMQLIAEMQPAAS